MMLFEVEEVQTVDGGSVLYLVQAPGVDGVVVERDPAAGEKFRQ
jgi:hypothetical protein